MLAENLPIATTSSLLGEPKAPVNLVAPLSLSTRDELRAFHARACEAADAFTARVKDPTGKELKEDFRLSTEPERRIDEWLASPEGARKAAQLGDRVLSFMKTAAAHGHPGHDARHVLFKDPIAALRLSIEECITDCP